MLLTAIVQGVRHEINNDDPSFLLGDTGLGMPPIRQITEQGPFQHGETLLDVRLQPRYFTLILGLFAGNFSQHFEKRRETIELFKHLHDEPIEFEFQLDNGDVRQIDGHFNSDLSFPSTSRQWADQEVSVEIYCPDPTFYNPVEDIISVSVPPGGGGWTVPMPVPVAVGTSTLDVIESVNYGGSWLAYPLITIVGPLTEPKIENESTEDKLEFKALTSIGAGQQRIIDTRYGIKTVVDENGVNKIAELTDDSDLATFHLSHRVAGGVNDIRVTGSGADANSRVYIRWNERFLGI